MTEKLRIPKIGEFVRSLGRLVKVEEIPQPTLVDYIFEEVDATIYAVANGIRVKQYSTFNEFYGEGTGIECAIEEAKKLHKMFDGNLTFIVEKTTSQTRRRPNEFVKECFYAPEYRHFKSLDHGSAWNVDEPIREVVWSSDGETE